MCRLRAYDAKALVQAREDVLGIVVVAAEGDRTAGAVVQTDRNLRRLPSITMGTDGWLKRHPGSRRAVADELERPRFQRVARVHLVLGGREARRARAKPPPLDSRVPLLVLAVGASVLHHREAFLLELGLQTAPPPFPKVNLVLEQVAQDYFMVGLGEDGRQANARRVVFEVRLPGVHRHTNAASDVRSS